MDAVSVMRRDTDDCGNAEACRRLARRMPPAQREQLLDMARQWDWIALQRELGVPAFGPAQHQAGEA